MKITFIIGTRPEAIKLAPVILKFKQQTGYTIEIISSGQHKEMLYQVLNIFGLKPDIDLDVMIPNQTLAYLTSKATEQIDKYLTVSKPDLLFCQGDTTTAFTASLAAFYNRVKIAHVEAGLRTGNKYSPFPEEINRKLISSLADYHFAPTETSKQNLILEGVAVDKIEVTGNTVIDALLLTVANIANSKLTYDTSLEEKIGSSKYILVTGHRRENFGEGFLQICEALRRAAIAYDDYKFVYPVHMNPNVKTVVQEKLGNINNIILHTPMDYVSFISLMQKSFFILTDSGGIQEEAPSLGKPVLVMRDTTERPEALLTGNIKLVGTNADTIFNEISNLIQNEENYKKMAATKSPYGDGMASDRIVEFIKKIAE